MSASSGGTGDASDPMKQVRGIFSHEVEAVSTRVATSCRVIHVVSFV
jgi:hypothetical protein